MATDVDQALADAYTSGFPEGWTLRHNVTPSSDGAYSRWTAARGIKPAIWSLLALRCGLRSTLVGLTVEEVRTEAIRQEWLITVYGVMIVITRAQSRARQVPHRRACRGL